MKKLLPITLALTLAVSAASAKFKQTVNHEPYPYGNPVITHMYTADPAPHVMPDGRVWMVTSVDHPTKGAFAYMHSYHTFSSADMVNWVDHGPIFKIEDVFAQTPEPADEDWALWAPDMIYHEGKYYLYYPIHTSSRGKKRKPSRSFTCVAVSDHPSKPFKIIQNQIPGTEGIDPCVFKDDDGKIYLYYGEHTVAQVANDMINIKGEPKVLDYDADGTLANDEEFQNMWAGKGKAIRKGQGNFVEASWMQKRNGLYIFNYHARSGREDIVNTVEDPTRRKSNLDYCVGDSPWGPFNHGGTLNYELGVGIENGPKMPGKNYVPWRTSLSNHGGVVEFHGTDYLFYHTTALSSWKQDNFKGEGTTMQRSTCIDKIEYDERGYPLPVKQTLEGVEAVKVDQPFEIALAEKSVLKNGVAIYKGVDLGTGYYYFDVKINNAKAKGRLEIRLGGKKGTLVGTCLVSPKKSAERAGLYDTFIRDAKGKQDIYLVWKGEKPLDEIAAPRIFAGSPLKL